MQSEVHNDKLSHEAAYKQAKLNYSNNSTQSLHDRHFESDTVIFHS